MRAFFNAAFREGKSDSRTFFHSASKFPTEQQPFSATVSGTSNTAVAWQVNGVTGGSASAGTIDVNGLYTAPAVVPSPNNPVMVTAVSQADVTKSGAATVTLKAPTPAGTYTVTITATAGSAAELQLEALEAKIHKALEKLTHAREENARLKQELAERDRLLAESQRERQEVRHRLERMLKQVDALTKDE